MGRIIYEEMKKLIFSIFTMLLAILWSHGQHQIKNLEELNGFMAIPKEKVFVHYNDNFLLAGEYLYYKVYCLNAEDQTPSTISKIGYVELVGKNSESIFRHKLRLTKGVGQGEFFIPANVASGHYKLTGYTQWMLNEGTETIFIDDLIIINPYQELPQVASSTSGNMLKLVKKDSASNAIDSTIFSKKANSSFKINLSKRTFGKRKPVILKITNSVGDDLVGNYSISVRKKNLVELPFRQSAIDFASGVTAPSYTNTIKIKEPISPAEPQGELISGKIISKEDDSPLSNQNISLSISGNEDEAKILRSDANGIFHFKLYESNSNDIILEAIGDKKDESKIVLDSITPIISKPKDIIPDLTAIQNKEAIEIGDQIYLPELRGELISGKILSNADGSPISNQDIGLSISGAKGIAKISRSDVDGIFYFNLDGSDRKNRIQLEVLKSSGDESKIILDSIGPLNLKSSDFKRITISPDLNSMIRERSIFNQIESAFFEQKADSILVFGSGLPVYKNFQETYVLDDYKRFKTFKETLVEIIENVFIKRIKGKLTLQVRSEEDFFVDSGDTPLLLIDGLMVQDLNNLLEYDIKKIDQINISRDEFYIGPKRYQGIVSIETKQDEYAQQIEANGLSTINMNAPLSMKEYYFQDYSGASASNKKHIADFRQQLLWKPNLELNEESILEFYTSDSRGDFEIQIEGFTSLGEPVSLSETILVE